MSIKVGTFNLNNLFSRFNFRGEIDAVPDDSSGGITLTFDTNAVSVRTFMGNLVKKKDAAGTVEVARRIKEVVDADVLAVQEVEHIEILKRFNTEHLGGMYPHIALVEGNDRRMIDVGVMSKLPLGTITSHQAATHPEEPNKRVFSRDLLQVEILGNNGQKLFNLYNTHLKSHFVPFGQDPVAGAAKANERRRKQAETISKIMGRMERPNSSFILTGDMNDPPDSPHLAAMAISDGQAMVNTLENPEETREAKPETAGQGLGPANTAWTHRFNPSGPAPAEYKLFDHIWVSQALANRVHNPTIDRRKKHGGDGSDHDPAWIELEF